MSRCGAASRVTRAAGSCIGRPSILFLLGAIALKIHEHQAKALFREFGIPVPRGVLARSADEAARGAEALARDGVTTPVRVVKAQVLAGGRGKAGGVKVVPKVTDVRAVAERILGMRLVTKQTGAEGVAVGSVLIEEGLPIDRELYLAVVLDRAARKTVIMASTMGGTEIEEVAVEHPEAIVREHVEPLIGLQDHQCRRMAFALGLAASRAQLSAATQMIAGVHRVFDELDATMVEINPLVVTKDGSIVALDGKISFDDNALFRHPRLEELRDTTEDDPLEVQAAASNLNYVRLDGNIGCMVNGAGLAMATMDMIQIAGGEPANFLDVGGGASAEGVADALRILLADPNVRAVLVNIFGGIVRCDLVAQGIVEGAARVDMRVPVVVRIEGTRAEEGRKILAEAKFKVIVASDMADAAEKAVKAAAGPA
jgi:succinyl-CoA synthetase beta subunit